MGDFFGTPGGGSDLMSAANQAGGSPGGGDSGGGGMPGGGGGNPMMAGDTGGQGISQFVPDVAGGTPTDFGFTPAGVVGTANDPTLVAQQQFNAGQPTPATSAPTGTPSGSTGGLAEQVAKILGVSPAHAETAPPPPPGGQQGGGVGFTPHGATGSWDTPPPGQAGAAVPPGGGVPPAPNPAAQTGVNIPPGQGFGGGQTGAAAPAAPGSEAQRIPGDTTNLPPITVKPTPDTTPPPTATGTPGATGTPPAATPDGTTYDPNTGAPMQGPGQGGQQFNPIQGILNMIGGLFGVPLGDLLMGQGMGGGLDPTGKPWAPGYDEQHSYLRPEDYGKPVPRAPVPPQSGQPPGKTPDPSQPVGSPQNPRGVRTAPQTGQAAPGTIPGAVPTGPTAGTTAAGPNVAGGPATGQGGVGSTGFDQFGNPLPPTGAQGSPQAGVPESAANQAAMNQNPAVRATAQHSRLAQARQPFAAQLQNPNTARLLAASTLAEVGGQGPLAEQAYVEEVMNRAASRRQSLDQALTDRGYYPGTTLNKLGRTVSPADQQRINGYVQRALAGSNVNNFATGNASLDKFGRPVGFAGGPMTYQPGSARGERFGIEGPDRAWAQSMRGGGPAQAAAGQYQGNTIRHTVANTLASSGMQPNAIAGVMANIREESGWNMASTGGSREHGLVQFSPTGQELGAYRQYQLRTGQRDSPQTQMAFLAQRLRTAYPQTWARMNAAQTPAQAAEIFAREYERPQANYLASRIANFRSRGVPSVEQQLGAGAPPAPVVGTNAPAPAPGSIPAATAGGRAPTGTVGNVISPLLQNLRSNPAATGTAQGGPLAGRPDTQQHGATGSWETPQDAAFAGPPNADATGRTRPWWDTGAGVPGQRMGPGPPPEETGQLTGTHPLPEITVKPPQAAEGGGETGKPKPAPPKTKPKAGMKPSQKRAIARRQAQSPPPVPKLSPYGSTSEEYERSKRSGYVQPGEQGYDRSMRYYYGR